MRTFSTYAEHYHDVDDHELDEIEAYDEENEGPAYNSNSDALCEDESIEFQEFKRIVNNQFKKTHKVDLLLTNYLKTVDDYLPEEEQFRESKEKTKTSSKTYEIDLNNSAPKPRYGLFREKNFFKQLIDEGIKHQEKIQQAIMEKQLSEIKKTILKIYRPLRKLEGMNQEENVRYNIDKRKKEFVDYILLAMTGIKNKNSEAYKDFSQLSYMTLLARLKKFLRRHHHLAHYTSFDDLQEKFIKYLYYCSHKSEALPLGYLDDLYIHPSQTQDAEEKPAEQPQDAKEKPAEQPQDAKEKPAEQLPFQAPVVSEPTQRGEPLSISHNSTVLPQNCLDNPYIHPSQTQDAEEKPAEQHRSETPVVSEPAEREEPLSILKKINTILLQILHFLRRLLCCQQTERDEATEPLLRPGR